MSYRCNVCREVVPNKTSRRVHRIMRDRTRGSKTVQEVAAEVQVCEMCSIKLQTIPYTELCRRHAPSPEELAAPEYVAGETKVKQYPQGTGWTRGVDWSSELGGQTVSETVAVQETTPQLPTGFLYSLFCRYGASSYWEAAFADQDPAEVADAIHVHWHLRKLWQKIHDLVPMPKRRRLQKPEPIKPIIRPIPVEVEGRVVAISGNKSKKRSK